MKKEIRFYLVWTLMITNLFYQEYWGLNALIVAAFTSLLFGYRYFFHKAKETPPTRWQTFHWLLGAVIWMTTATAVFLGAGGFSIFLYLVSLSYFISLQDRTYISVPLGFAQTVQSFATGMMRIFKDRIPKSDEPVNARRNKNMRQLVLFSSGLFICILFLKLYQLADKNFYELTAFLNLEWISWGFIASYLIVTWTFYGLYFYKSEQQITSAEVSLKNEIDSSYSDRIQEYVGVENENRFALIILSVLCAMLVLLLALDIKFMLTEFGLQRPVSAYSETVHQGVNALIFSLVLVMILISYLFRGSLNFNPSKTVKIIGTWWLILNCILVITTGFKNYDYILNFGLTYKRLGVSLYLFLCGIGLVFSVYKIHYAKSIWFLLRNTILSFVACFALVSLFNWNSIIAKYNLSHLKTERLDLEYLYELGPDTYPYLLNYHIKNNISKTALFQDLVASICESRDQLQAQLSSATWRSYNVRDHKLYDQLMSYQFTGNPEATHSIVASH